MVGPPAARTRFSSQKDCGRRRQSRQPRCARKPYLRYQQDFTFFARGTFTPVKVHLDAAKCTGHAQCFAVDGELFPIDDSGYSCLEPREVAPCDVAATREAADTCPEGAIIIEDD